MRFVVCALGVLALCACPNKSRPPEDACNTGGPNPCEQPDRNLCVTEDGQPRCLCNAGFLPRPSGACEPVDGNNCPEHPGDEAEPDDCLARAQQLNPAEGPRQQSVEPTGDYDFFTFAATARSVYVLTVKPEGSLMARVDLFDQGGVALAAREEVGQTVLSFKAATTARLYARVSHSPVDPHTATGQYALTLQTVGPEDHGEGPTGATPISTTPSPTVPLQTLGRFEYPGDQDWFSFAGATGLAYRLTFDTSQSPAPPAALFLSSNPDAAVWTKQQSIIDFELPANETVYLVLYAPAGLGSYGFAVSSTRK